MTGESTQNEADDLTDKQEAFCREYIIDFNGTKAAIRAGYAENSARSQASDLLTKPNIRRRIDQLVVARTEKTHVTQEYVLSVLTETVERARQTELLTDRRGQPILIETPAGQVAAAHISDMKAILKGAELLGKHLRMFADVKQIEGNPDKPVEHRVKVDEATVAAIMAKLNASC